MNNFNTINELVGDIKQKINELHMITDTLLMDYRNAADLISEKDHRQKPLEEMRSLYSDLSEIVNNHPALNTRVMYQNVVNSIADIAEGEKTLS